MTPLGWKWAGFVWAYAIVWALLTDRVKLLGYRVLDHVKADKAKPESKADQSKPETKGEAKPDAKADEPKPEDKADAPKPDAKADAPKTDAKADEPKPDAKADQPKPEAKADAPKPDAKADQPNPEAKDKPQPEVAPQLVKRVHELYEQLGREDVQTVQDWEKAEPKRQETESHK
jgi:H+-transporting ATPase